MNCSINVESSKIRLTANNQMGRICPDVVAIQTVNNGRMLLVQEELSRLKGCPMGVTGMLGASKPVGLIVLPFGMSFPVDDWIWWLQPVYCSRIGS